MSCGLLNDPDVLMSLIAAQQHPIILPALLVEVAHARGHAVAGECLLGELLGPSVATIVVWTEVGGD